MVDNPKQDPLAVNADVTLVLNEGTWEVSKEEQEVHKKPGETFSVEAPKTLPRTNWGVWFNPAGPGLEPDENNRVVVSISLKVPYERNAGARQTWYKYTILADGQVIDPKIIIDPPT